MTTVAIHQPQYLPWLPYFAKADSSDIFVYLDNVQFQKNGVQNRNQIKTANGPAWLTVPVRASLQHTISDTPIDDGQCWQQKHLRSLAQAYAGAEYKALLDTGVRELIEREWHNLGDLNIALTEWMFEQLGVKCRRVRASQLPAAGAKDDLVLGICTSLGADRYLSGHGAKAYQDEAKFAAAGVELSYFDYVAPTYRQCHMRKGFEPNLSALDCLLNVGPDSRSVMLSGKLNEK